MSAQPMSERKVLFHMGKIAVHKPRGVHQYFDEMTAGYALFPLVVLFGLNALDEADRAMFGVLAPTSATTSTSRTRVSCRSWR